ncbi:tim-barrel domain-containing protein, partial [Baffinella frigidus]
MSSKKGTAQAAKWAVNPVVLGVAFILSFYVGGVYFFHSTRSAEVAGVGSTILSVEAPHDPSLQRVHTSVASKHSHGRGRRTDGTVGGGAVGGKAVGKHGKTVSVWSAAEVSLDDRKKAAEELVRRVVGEKFEIAITVVIFFVGIISAVAFKIEVVEKLPEAQDFFEIKETGATGDTGVILLRGSSGVAVASALNWYLRYDAHVDTSWNTPFPVSLQSPPPMPKKFTRRRAMVKWGYYENVCTFSYSQAWWQWERWEKEIDWMAMSGINLPLALTGQ